MKVDDKKIDLSYNEKKEINSLQYIPDDKPVTYNNIKGNLFVNLMEIENIDNEDFEIPVINPFYVDKKISIVIPKDSQDILKNSDFEKVNNEKIDIPILVREIKNQDYSDDGAVEEDINVVNYNRTGDTKNGEYLPAGNYYNESVKSEVLQLNILEIEDIDENIKKVPFKIINKGEENLKVIEHIENKVFKEVKIPEEINYKAYLKIDEQKGSELYILADESSNSINHSLETKDIILNLENTSKNEDGSLSIPIKIISDKKIDNENNQGIIDNNSKIYISPRNMEVIKANVRNLSENSDVKVPVALINSADKDGKISKVFVETNKNIIMEIINYDSKNLINGEKVDRITENSYGTNDAKQIKVKLILTIREESVETENISINKNESGKSLSEIWKNNIIEKEIVNYTTKNDNNAKLINSVNSTKDTIIKEVFKIPVEISAGGHEKESDNGMIKANLIIERNVNDKSKGYASSSKNIEVESGSIINFNFQKTNSSGKSLNSENFSFGSNLIKSDKEESDFEAGKVNEILFRKGEGFINELNKLNGKNDSGNSISMNNREIIENNIERIVNEARMILRRGKSEIRMELEPKSLGKMDMKITMENSNLIAKIRFDSQEAKNLFTENINRLKEALNENGVQIQRIDVFVRDGLNNFTRYNFSEYRQSFYNHYRENRLDNYDEKESNLLFSMRNMGYNTIELVA